MCAFFLPTISPLYLRSRERGERRQVPQMMLCIYTFTTAFGVEVFLTLKGVQSGKQLAN